MVKSHWYLWGLLAVTGLACDATSPYDQFLVSEDNLVDGAAYSFSDHEESEFLVGHSEGSYFAAVKDPTSSGLTVVYGTVDEFVVGTIRSDGFPDVLFLDNETVVFGRWSDGAVDVARIGSDGSVRVERGVLVRRDGLMSRAQGLSGIALVAASAQSLLTGMCAAAASTDPPASSVSGCASSILQVAAALGPTDTDRVRTSANSIGLAGRVFGCRPEDPETCGRLLDERIGTARAALVERQTEDAARIGLASGVVESGGGDVQVTLTWLSTADLDLLVTDPTGEVISFNNRTSASGGTLDVDDVDGFGPENVFWPSGTAPLGDYEVHVQHFRGSGSATFELLVQAFGQTRAFSQTLAPGATERVAEFDASAIRGG